MRRRSLDPDVQQALERLLAAGFSPARAVQRLDQEAQLTGRVPSLRTVQRVASELRPPDTSDTWRLVEADPDEARLVLPVLGALIEAGSMTSITQETARWIARIQRAAPGLAPLDVARFALRYLSAEMGERPTGEIDRALALALTGSRPPS